jgi:hypothetical protein
MVHILAGTELSGGFFFFCGLPQLLWANVVIVPKRPLPLFPLRPPMSSVRICCSSWLHDRSRTHTLGKWRRLSSYHLLGSEKARYSSYLKQGVTVACIWEVSILEIHDAVCDIRAIPYVMLGRRPIGSGAGHRQDVWDPQVCLQ